VLKARRRNKGGKGSGRFGKERGGEKLGERGAESRNLLTVSNIATLSVVQEKGETSFFSSFFI
jgi:hypothetical protein